MLKISNHEKEFTIPRSDINGVMQHINLKDIMIFTNKGCITIPFLSVKECSNAVAEIHYQLSQH